MRRESYLCSDLVYVTLTSREKATLQVAAGILERLREMRDTDDDPLGVDIALAGYVLRDLTIDEIQATPA